MEGSPKQLTGLLVFMAMLAGCDSDGGRRTEFSLVGYVDDLDGSIELALNGGANTVVENTYEQTLSAAFEFPQKLKNGEAFEVSIIRQPEHHHCQILEPEGVFDFDNRPIIYVSCERAVEVFRELEVSDFAIGADHACASIGGDIRCFGGAFVHESVWQPPQFAQAPVFDAGKDVTCAGFGRQLSCWGIWADELNRLRPEISGGVLELGVGWRSACLVDDDGLKCWGDPASPIVQNYPRALVSPEHLEVRLTSACVVDAGRPYCWAFEPGIEAAPEDLTDVVALDPVAEHVCAVRAGGAVVCWPEAGPATLVPADLNPAVTVTTRSTQTCAVTLDGLRCWGEGPDRAHLDDLLEDPDTIQLSGGTGGSIGCAMDGGRLFCFGSDIQNGIDLPQR